MKLTKEKALKICKKLWEKMRDRKCNSVTQKQEIMEEMGYPNFQENCPCCEYQTQHNQWKIYCPECLLHNLWGKDNTCELGNKDSPYLSFTNASGTPANAQRIIDGCNAALKAIKRKAVRQK